VEYRRLNFRAYTPREKRGVMIDGALYRAVQRMARKHQMSVSWFVEEVLEITTGVDVRLARVGKVKPAYHTRRKL
jgi:hypothetical protein